MLRFRIFGVPFAVTGYFWLGCILLGGIGQSLAPRAVLRLAVWTGCVFLSVVVHEMGHALAGRKFGADPAVVLHGIGGMTYLPGLRATRWRSILVSLAGPAAGFALWAVVLLIAQQVFNGPHDTSDPVIYAMVMGTKYLLYINLVWTLFNLLPILPMDGGQVLREVLGPRWISATRAIGGLVAVVIAAWALSVGQIFLALFLGYLAYLNFRGDPRSIPGGVSK